MRLCDDGDVHVHVHLDPSRAIVVVIASVALVCGVAACAPVPDDAGEGEGEGEPACANGRLTATAGADVDVDTCLTTRSLSEDGRELLFALDETFDLRISSTVALEPLPLVLDDQNSSTIASYDDGEHLWRISDGQILGVAVGEGTTTLERADDDGVHGFFEGVAFDNDLGEEIVDPMTLRVDF